MAISSSVLFHFTNKRENLINILTNEFQPRLCLEKLGELFPGLRKDIWEPAIPMVCFCDLPLSMVKEHLKVYGNYGIGLSKKWGIRNGINPVIYLSPSSYLCEYIFNILSTFVDGDERYKIIGTFIDITGFVKPYEGVMSRDGKDCRRCFYDEREWRYVPRLSESKHSTPLALRVRKKEFMDSLLRSKTEMMIGEVGRLSFEPKDIRYIIVEKENEILPMIRDIKAIKSKFDPDTVSILSTRIISSVQISQDF